MLTARSFAETRELLLWQFKISRIFLFASKSRAVMFIRQQYDANIIRILFCDDGMSHPISAALNYNTSYFRSKKTFQLNRIWLVYHFHVQMDMCVPVK